MVGKFGGISGNLLRQNLPTVDAGPVCYQPQLFSVAPHEVRGRGCVFRNIHVAELEQRTQSFPGGKSLSGRSSSDAKYSYNPFGKNELMHDETSRYRKWAKLNDNN